MPKVAKSYSAAYTNPISIRSGERLFLFEKESEWPGWVWCRAADGKEGWVPISYICNNNEEYAAVYDYDAKELSAGEGETVEILREESGWVWCRSSQGIEGWLPLECLDLSSGR